MCKKKVLVTQLLSDTDKVPYIALQEKHDVEIIFYPFTILQGLSAKEFRAQKIDIAKYTCVIFTSRHAITHFFRICEEARIAVSPSIKYFCTTETVALYLQKFILYRRRKVLFTKDGSHKEFFALIKKHRADEKFLYICSQNQYDRDIVAWLESKSVDFNLGAMYRTENADVNEVMMVGVDVVCFFTPASIRCFVETCPKFKQGKLKVGVFGSNTLKIAEEVGLKVGFSAPTVVAQSMVVALDTFLLKTVGDE